MMATSARNRNKGAKPSRLRRRSEFLRAAASGQSRVTPAFKIQAAPRADAEEPRFGFTVTKKTGGAVERNRIRRRLRQALRLGGALAAAQGYDYVFVARRAALTTPFSELIAQMAEGISRIGRTGAAPGSPTRKKKSDRSPAP